MQHHEEGLKIGREKEEGAGVVLRNAGIFWHEHRKEKTNAAKSSVWRTHVVSVATRFLMTLLYTDA